MGGGVPNLIKMICAADGVLISSLMSYGKIMLVKRLNGKSQVEFVDK